MAAGVLSPRTTVGLAFNGLKVVGAGPAAGLGQGEVKFVYDRYVPPAAAGFSFQTIVKVLPVFEDQRAVTVPAFQRFDNDGFVVRLTLGGAAPLDQATLDRTTLMVEVSEYGRIRIS